MTNKEKLYLISEMAAVLDTRDKRYMFIKAMFHDIDISRIQLEGSAHVTCYNIADEFEKQSMLGSLAACLNNTFDLNITINYKTNHEQI